MDEEKGLRSRTVAEEEKPLYTVSDSLDVQLSSAPARRLQLGFTAAPPVFVYFVCVRARACLPQTCSSVRAVAH